MSVSYHAGHGLKSLGQTVDDQRELVFADIDEAFFILFHVLDRLCGLQTGL